MIKALRTFEVKKRFVGDAILEGDLEFLLQNAYSENKFNTRDANTVPIRPIGDDLFLETTDYSIDHSFDIKFNKSDAIAIANHFNLIPEINPRLKESIAQYERGEAKECLNGELVELVTNDDFKIGGFMTAERNDD